MIVKFSMDGIKNMDLLYFWSDIKHEDGVCSSRARIKHDNTNAYCDGVTEDVFKDLKALGWQNHKRLGVIGRIGAINYVLTAEKGKQYEVEMVIDTYNDDLARLTVALCVDGEAGKAYDSDLEALKIHLKNRLLRDWNLCTWLIDDQSTFLCKEAYERAAVVENRLRAFSSKVLIHYLGIKWLDRAGFEKYAESVGNLKGKFTQRVPEFDNINTDFLSMTLETLVGIIFKGVVYEDEVILSKGDYLQVQKMGSTDKIKSSAIASFIAGKRKQDINIWEDLFVRFIDDLGDFKNSVTRFIEDRNHVAHSKVLSWSAFRMMNKEFLHMEDLIRLADDKFERDEASDEVTLTNDIIAEERAYSREFYRSRISEETGMEILDEAGIIGRFDESIYEIYSKVYQQYHLDVSYEISDYYTLGSNHISFSVACPVDEDGNIRVDIQAEYSIDDNLGEDSTCYLVLLDGDGTEISQTEIFFHNGNGAEGENGLMVATDNTEYDDSGLEEFLEDIIEAIGHLNPYPDMLVGLEYESKGAEQFVSDYPCEECGKLGVSINEAFLSIGKCCFCGCENEMETCDRCGGLVNVSEMTNGFCPACSEYVKKNYMEE